MSAAAAQMAAGAGDEAEWMMGGDDERLIRSAHSHSGKSLFGSAPSPSGESAAVDWSAQSDAADSASARTAACDWPALVAAAVAEAAHDEQHSLPALSALAAALSALSASTSASTSAAANSSPAAISSTVPAASSVLLSLWPLLPSLYSTLIRPPSSGRRSAVVLRHVVECVLQLSLAFPSSVLLARSELDSAGAAVESESHPCLWSALAAAIDAQCGLSQLSSALLAVSSAGASELFRCCASLLPSTLSVLSVYGDVVGSVLPALYRATDQARTVLFDARSSSLLCQYAAGVVRCVVLTHTPIDVVDGLDPLLPASLSVLSSTSSSPSSSSLSAFPAVSSESALFFPTVSLFDLRLVPDSHPDVDRAHLHSIAVSLVSELAEAVQRCGLLSPSACLHIELLLFVVRQRSVAYVSLCVPIFLRLAGQLSSLPSSCYVSSALHTVRLGLFSLFRLSSCSAYWSAILNVLAQPASSILAMETQRINKQRNQQQQQQQQQAPQQQQQRQQQHSIGAPFGQSTVMPQLSSSDVPLPALREVVDVGSAGLQSLLSSVFSLPLPLICDLILRSLHALPVSLSGQQQQQQQQVLIQVQAATKLLHWKSASDGTLTKADRQQQSESATLPPPAADASPPSSFTVPPLATQPLSTSAQSSLSRLCFVRLLSTNVELAAGQRKMAALRAALLPTITVASGAIEYTVEVTDSQLLTHWAAEQQQQHEHSQQYDEEEEEDDAEEDGSASTRSLLSSLRLSSSLSSTAQYSALLTYILSDAIERYELAITFAYKLARLTPHSVSIIAPHVGDEDEQHATERILDTSQQLIDHTAQQHEDDQDGTSPQQQQQQQQPDSAPQLHDEDETVQPGAAVLSGSDIRRGKRQLIVEDSSIAEQGSSKQQRTAHGDGGATEQKTQLHAPFATDSSLPIVSPQPEDDSGGVARSPRFLFVLSTFFRFHGGVEYQQLADGLLTALESALFSAAAATVTPSVSSPACSTLLQLLLDLPLLPPSVWSTMDRYLASASSQAVGLLALRVLIEQRPPASGRAMRLLLRYAAVGGSAARRRSCVELAVECIATAAASASLRSIVVQRALTMAAAVADPVFLADLPTLTVNIVVPPAPLYDDIQLLPARQPQHALEATAASSGSGTTAAVAVAGTTTIDSSISSLLSAVVGGGSGSSDGSEEADEARRRSIQQLIADGARRKKEFDKLVLRRQLLLKEKELRERQADERQQQREQTTQTHLALLFALLHSSPRIAFDSAVDETRPLFERLWSVYAASSAAEPARKLIHSFLPALVLAVGPTLPLLTSLQSQPAACDPCVLHVLQLLCTAPPQASEDSAQAQQPATLTAAAREHSLVHPTSTVSVVCWYLYHSRRGDARFIIPLLPMLRADQLRRCLHRIVALPPVHLKVALHRMLRPHLSLAAKGNKLTQPHPQSLSPGELVIALHRIDQHRRAALPLATTTSTQRQLAGGSSTGEPTEPPISLPLSAPLSTTVDLSLCPSSSAPSNYPSDDGVWLRSLIAAVQLCFASVDLFPASSLANVLSALRLDRPLSRLFLRTCIQCVQLQPSLTSFVLSVVHSLVRSERSMVGVSLLWEGVLKLASLSLPQSLDLLLDLPDEGVARLLGSLTPSQLLATVQTADTAASEAAADKAAGRKPAKPVKQTPLQMCQVAVARAVLQQPQRVRHVYRKHVMSSEPQPYQQPLSAQLTTQSRLPADQQPQLPPPPAPHFAPPSAFDRSGWSSSHPPNPLTGPAVQPFHPPAPLPHTAAAAAAAAVAAGGAGLGAAPSSLLPPFLARPPPLPSAPSAAAAAFASAAPLFHRPFAAGPSPHFPHPTVGHKPPAAGAVAGISPFPSGPIPAPLPQPQALAGGWKSVRIPAAAATTTTAATVTAHSHSQPQTRQQPGR